MACSIISHKGKEVIYVDYRDCKEPADRLALLEVSFKTMMDREGEQLILLNVEGQPGDREYMKRAKEIEKRRTGKISKRAILGIEGMKKVLLMGINKFSNDRAKLIPFHDKDTALDYLIE